MRRFPCPTSPTAMGFVLPLFSSNVASHTGRLTLETVKSEELWLFLLRSGEELFVRRAHK